MKKNILMTGASGFIGRAMFEPLLKSKHQFSIVARNKQNVTPSIIEFLVDSICSDNNWTNELQGVDVIVHLAAVAHNTSNDPNYINEVNVKGTINLAEQAVAMGVKRFIFISSIGVLGNSTTNKKIYDEHTIGAAHSECNQSKFDAEKALLKISEETELEVVIIRPVLVYGASAPGNFGQLVNLVHKLPTLPFAMCKNKRSFISVENLADFICTCIDHPKAKNEIFCISDDNDISIKGFTDEIAKGLNKRLIQLPIPMSILKLLGKITGRSEQIEQLIGDLQVDSSKARNLLDWAPSVTMAETLSKLTINN